MVTLIDELSGKIVGAYKAEKGSLPEVFNRPMVMEVEGVRWRVVKAERVKGKQLSLHVQEEGYFRARNKRSMVPTMAVPRPTITGQCLVHDSMLEVGLEEWRQIEFLPAAMQEVVEEEVRLIDAMVANGDLLGYETVHVREDIPALSLSIPFNDFYQLVEGKKKGIIQLKGEGIVEDGFFIRSEGYVYYGVLEDKCIKQLCLQNFDCADEELTNVITEHNLMLVDWCKGSII